VIASDVAADDAKAKATAGPIRIRCWLHG